MITTILPELLIAFGLFALMLIASQIGHRLGLRSRREGETDASLATVQGGLLGLLALLLGFAFAGAAGRFIDRQHIMLREANAIGTAYLRTDVLPPAVRDEIRAALRDYAADRLALFHALAADEADAVRQRLAAHHARAWTAAANVSRQEHAFMNIILPPLNEIIDLLAERDASVYRHLPMPVMSLLMMCAVVSIFIVGRAQGLAGHPQRGPMLTLAFLIAAALWITIDLDYPRRGVIRMSAAPLESAIASMREPPKP